jgi:hypothetical protein
MSEQELHAFKRTRCECGKEILPCSLCPLKKCTWSGTDCSKFRLGKSPAASKVLQLMDEDVPYKQSLFLALESDKRLSRVKLEKELEKYI